MSVVYAIVDLETTGGSPRRERIIDIAIILTDGEKELDRYETLVNPQKTIPPRITQLTGIANQMVADAPRFCEVARDVLEFTEGTVIVAHNSRFDYYFLKHEFRLLGYNFQRKHLCTVKLSRKIIPGMSSYSLGKLCRELKISVKNRHRAMGDAEATTELFHLLVDTDRERFIDDALLDEIRDAALPPLIERHQIDELPDETGVYYIYDDDGNVLYVGKSKDIRKRIVEHCREDDGKRRAREMRKKMAGFSCEVTGSELVALLKEADEIKKLNPPYNRALRRIRYQYGLFQHQSGEYISLKIKKLTGKKRRKRVGDPLIPYKNYREAQRDLNNLMSRFHLCQKLCGLYKSRGPCFHFQIKKCRGACAKKESPEEYNLRVEEALQAIQYSHTHFLVIGEGRFGEEKSLVLVEDGEYKGFGFFDPEDDLDNLEQIRDLIQPYPENKDIQRILRDYLRKNKYDQVVQFDPDSPTEFASTLARGEERV